jgi:hypothetical protein
VLDVLANAGEAQRADHFAGAFDARPR